MQVTLYTCGNMCSNMPFNIYTENKSYKVDIHKRDQAQIKLSHKSAQVWCKQL